MVIIVFFLYFFLYLFRIMALWILVILSPLAFVFYVFPATKKFFDMWWNNFLAWCIIVIPISFFLWISSQIVSGMANTSASIGGASTTCAGTPSISPIGFLVPGAFMILGFLFSLQFSAMGVSIAVSAFKKTGKLSGSTLKDSRLGQKISRWVVRAG